MTSSDGSPVAKARPANLVMKGPCKEDVSPQRSASLVNLVMTTTDNELVWPHETSAVLAQISKLKVPECIEKRMLIWPQGNLGRKT